MQNTDRWILVFIFRLVNEYFTTDVCTIFEMPTMFIYTQTKQIDKIVHRKSSFNYLCNKVLFFMKKKLVYVSSVIAKTLFRSEIWLVITMWVNVLFTWGTGGRKRWVILTLITWGFKISVNAAIIFKKPREQDCTLSWHNID